MEVREPPSTLRLYGKALGSLVRRGGGTDLPTEEVVRHDVDLRREHVTAYQEVCGFTRSDRLPWTYLHVTAFPLSLFLLTRRDFPFALPGMVHVANRITVRRPLTVADRPTLRVRTEQLRPHPAGQQLDVVATAEVGSDIVWEDISTYLSRGERHADTEVPGPEVDLSASRGAARLHVPADVGRRYAAVSGDANPIHLHPLTAKAFGFPRAIAHGMWTAARCLAGLEGRHGDTGAFDVRFEKPVLLPSTTLLTSDRDDRTWRLALHDRTGDRRHLTAEVSTDE